MDRSKTRQQNGSLDPVAELVRRAATLTAADRRRLALALLDEEQGSHPPFVENSRITSRYEQLRTAVDASRVGLWEWNAVTGETSFNDMWYKLIGFEPGELPEEIDSWADLVHPDDKERTFADLGDYLEGRSELYLNIHRLRHKDGYWVWIRDCGVTTRRTEEGKPWILIGTHVDVSPLKTLETELIEARRQAEANAQAKTRFLAQVSHELRTPMTGILGLGELLLRSELDPEQRSWLETSHRSARHLLRLLDDLLEITRIESGAIQIEESRFSWSRLLDDLTRIAHSRALEKSVRLGWQSSTEVDTVLGDEGLIRQVLTNLITNALAWTRPESSVAVRLRGKPSGPDHLLFEVEVEDEGPGIPREHWDHVFERFRRSEDPSHQGMGLGLTISRRLMSEMGGDLQIVRSDERGSVFRTSLRMAVANEPVYEAEPELEKDYASRAWVRQPVILVADDDGNNRLVLQAMLEVLGCQVVLARDGVEATQFSSAPEPDAIFMDYEMPRMNGFDATITLRERGFDGPIISLSAHASSSFAVSAHQARMDDVLAKPFFLEELENCLQRHLGHLR